MLLMPLFALSVMLVSCQKEQPAADKSAADLSQYASVTEALASENKVAFLAENFDKSYDEKQAAAISVVFLSLNQQEMDLFIDLSYKKSLRERANPERAALVKDFKHAVNLLAFQKTGKSVENADNETFTSLLSTVKSSGKYKALFEQSNASAPASAGRTSACASCEKGFWYRTGTIATTSSGGSSWPMERYMGKYNFNYIKDGVWTCSTDCDYVFRSQKYNRYYRPGYIYATSQPALNALRWSSAGGEQPFTTVALSGSEEYFEFLIGKGRVDYSYGYAVFPGSEELFRRDVTVRLLVR